MSVTGTYFLGMSISFPLTQTCALFSAVWCVGWLPVCLSCMACVCLCMYICVFVVRTTMGIVGIVVRVGARARQLCGGGATLLARRAYRVEICLRRGGCSMLVTAVMMRGVYDDRGVMYFKEAVGRPQRFGVGIVCVIVGSYFLAASRPQ
jgi:hypothetical protein